jgi:hypothetical protein
VSRMAPLRSMYHTTSSRCCNRSSVLR